jgi:hypothetical protein
VNALISDCGTVLGTHKVLTRLGRGFGGGSVAVQRPVIGEADAWRAAVTCATATMTSGAITRLPSPMRTGVGRSGRRRPPVTRQRTSLCASDRVQGVTSINRPATEAATASTLLYVFATTARRASR